MQLERYQQIKAIAQAALQLAPEQRSEYVHGACTGNPILAQEVLDWLTAAESAERDGFLERAEIVDVPPAEIEGTAQNRYRILSELGRGGMGVVYLAERADGEFRQQVALKQVNWEVGNRPELLERFRAERQILADLHHPNIAQLLDGGSARDGRPFLVMEYIEGQRIDHYCESLRLPVADCLRLFVKVCSAVQFAHQNLVIHRDLKPGNILVDAAGEPKLLDFGIAKLLAPANAPAATETALGQRLLTYGYASPEQILGKSMGTASDVYSLGVVLYRLLTGRLPFGNDMTMAPELARAICEDAPTPPSASATLTFTNDAAIEKTQQSSARPFDVPAMTRWRKHLSSDLDHIVLKALRKEPAQRYATVAEFADDVRRHLDGMPVLARRGSTWYAARKFVGRHRAAVAAVAAFVALLIGAVVALQLQLQRTQIERDKARAVTDFVIGMFEGSDPTGEQTRDSAHSAKLTVREVLDASAPRIEAEMADQPEVKAALLAAVARVYTGLNLLEPAQRYMSSALQSYQSQGAARGREIVEARLYLGEVQARLDHFDAALQNAESALVELRQLASGDDFDSARALRLRGSALLRLDRNREAQRDLEAALAMLERLYGKDHPYAIGTVKDLAGVAGRKGDFKLCETLAKDAYAGWEKHYGPKHLVLASALMQLAYCRGAMGHGAEAEATYQQVLELYRTALGPRNVSVAFAMNDLALLWNQRGNYAEAEPMLREAVAILREQLGSENPQVGTTLTNLSTSLSELGRMEESIAVLEQALAIIAKNSGAGTEDPIYAIGLNNMGFKLRKMGRDEEAEARFRAALAILDKQDQGHPNRATVLHNLGRLLLETQRAAAAEPLLRQSLEIRLNKLTADHWAIAEVRSALGECLAKLGQRKEAEPLLRLGHAGALAKLGAEHERTRKAAQRLHDFQSESGEVKGAKPQSK